MQESESIIEMSHVTFRYGGTAAEDKSATEAGKMAAWLIENGVAPERVLVEDKAMPDMMLVSPEGRWAIVNVAALAADGAASQYAVARLNKEMVRAFAYLAGGCGSEFAGNLMDHITRPDQLDAYSEARPPMDVLAKVSRRLSQLGITPQRMATYQQACKEGWAPAPTNDVQRTIWNEVHQLPSKPLKIEFDPAKGK